jgi:hypothetical protein
LLFVAGFDIAQHIGSWGISGAFDLEADSLPVGLADILVGNRSRCASTFERGRVGKVFGLCRRPISLSQGAVHTDACHVRYHRDLSAAVGSRQATPDSLRLMCPSAS